MLAAIIYFLCAATCLASALLLLRSYQRTRSKLLLWSGLCFAGLTATNVLLVVDRLVLPEVDLYTLRLVTALVSVLLLLYGLIWEHE